MRERGDEEGEGGARAGLLPRRRPPPQPPSPSSPSPSSSPPAMEGGKNKNKKGDITKAIWDRLSFSSPGARLSCWGHMGTTRHRIRRSWSRSGSGSGSGTAGGGRGTPLAVMATITSSCVCINGNPCRCSGTRNGKAAAVAAAAGVRSLIERNDFYCHECNTHTL